MSFSIGHVTSIKLCFNSEIIDLISGSLNSTSPSFPSLNEDIETASFRIACDKACKISSSVGYSFQITITTFDVNLRSNWEIDYLC